MSCDFQTTTHGKWILAGEHAVVRGHSALVFPLLDKTLTLRYTYQQQSKLDLSANIAEQNSDTTQILLQKILDHGLRCINRSNTSISGELHIESNIPVGVGMGASAALCVAITRWFASQQWICLQDEFRIARELEHFFHGQSSGLDIIGVSHSVGMHFQQSNTQPIQPTWSPNWRLSFCGQQGPTAHCVHTVQKLWSSSPEIAQSIDLRMQAAVMHAKQALEDPFTQDNSQQRLAQAIQQAHGCFQDWGLIPPALQQHMQNLLKEGALAVKPTGSGGGGYAISLWA